LGVSNGEQRISGEQRKPTLDIFRVVIKGIADAA